MAPAEAPPVAIFSTLSAGHLKAWWDGHRQGPRQTKNAWLGDQKSSSHRHGNEKWMEMIWNDFFPKNITDSPFIWHKIHRNPTKFCIFPGKKLGVFHQAPALVRWCGPKFSAPRRPRPVAIWKNAYDLVWFGMVWICLNRAVDELLMSFCCVFLYLLII